MSLLTIANLSLRFPNTDVPALQNINYQAQPGDFIILLGGNGSGKSSLLKLLYRHYLPTTGSIEFSGKPLAQYPPRQFKHQINILTQNCNDSLFPTLTVFENYLLTQPQRFNRKSQHRVFLKNYLQDFNPNLAHKLNLTVEQLSGGEKQALALALCFLTPPTLLLLDEHTSALDPKTAAQIMQLTANMIAKHHMTCILTTHDLDIALRYGNRILMLHEGHILKTFEAAEKQQLSKENLLHCYYT